MTEKLIYELNGKKYLLVTMPLKSRRNMEVLKNLGGLFQSYGIINKSGWFSSDIAVVNVLVPEDKVQKLTLI